mgnify:CR=1 FL=1
MDAGVDLGLLVIPQKLSHPDGSERLRIACALFFPGFERLVVEELRSPERALKIRLGMRSTEVMAARPDFADRVHSLSVLAYVDALCDAVQRAQLIRVHHEFFVGGHQAALKPPAGMQHEIDARQEAHIERVRGFIRCLGVR